MNIAGIAVSLARGGAGLAAERLFSALDAQPGTKVQRYIARRDPGSPRASLFTEPGRFRVVADQAADVLRFASGGAWQAWNAGRNFAALERMLEAARPDVISLHGFNQWYRPTIPPGQWLALAARAPMVWTLHDLWPVTGCCDYLTACPSIPAERVADGSTRADCPRSLAAWECGKAAWESARGRLVLVSPSRWLAETARRWCGDRCRVEAIANGLDLEAFRPHDRAEARKALGWPEKDRLVLAVAENLDVERKGMALLWQACGQLQGRARLVSLGETDAKRWPGGTVHAGFVTDPRLLRLVYSAANVVVVPSRLDNLPNVLLEALACGVPCVAFRAGGMPEAVRPGSTGELAAPGDARNLADKIAGLLSLGAEQSAALSRSCRAVAESDYDARRQAVRYAELFQSMIAA